MREILTVIFLNIKLTLFYWVGIMLTPHVILFQTRSIWSKRSESLSLEPCTAIPRTSYASLRITASSLPANWGTLNFVVRQAVAFPDVTIQWPKFTLLSIREYSLVMKEAGTLMPIALSKGICTYALRHSRGANMLKVSRWWWKGNLDGWYYGAGQQQQNLVSASMQQPYKHTAWCEDILP